MAQGQGLGLQSIVVVVALIGALSAPYVKSAVSAETKESAVHPTVDPTSTRAAHEPGKVVPPTEHEPVPAEPSTSQRLALTFSTLMHDLYPESVRLGETDPAAIARGLRGRPKLVPIVVGVPDPQQSHMALYYDQTLGALREAAAKIGYVSARFNLPWEHALRLHPIRGAASRPAFAADLEREPGLLLLRRDSQLPAQAALICPTQADELIVLLLVLESAVLGPKMAQLDASLSFVERIASTNEAAFASRTECECCQRYRTETAERHQLHVLGPFFSGGASAYRAALTQHPMSAFVITGTATSPAVDETLSAVVEFERAVPTDVRLAAWVKNQLRWRAVSLRDRTIDWLLNRVHPPPPALDDSEWQEKLPRPYLAELTETGTVYGQTAADDEHTVQRRLPPECPRYNQSGISSAPCSTGEQAPTSDEDLPTKNPGLNLARAKTVEKDKVRFGFPLHISEIRAEREVVLAQQADLFPSIRRTLGLKLNPEEEQETDVPATLSSLTAYDDDLKLGQELSHICDQHFRYVLVEATDPVDVIFLAQQVRKFCRDMVLVTLGYDDLFVHPDLGSTMSGTIVASAFAPSFAISSFVDGHTNHPFANSVSQGFFNAFLRIAAEVGAATPTDSQPIGATDTFFLGEIAGAKIWPTRVVPSGRAPTNLDASHPAEMQRARLLSSAPPANKTRTFAWPVLFIAVIHLWLRFNRHGMFCRVGPRFKLLRRVRLAVADGSLVMLILLTALPLTYLLKEPKPGAWARLSASLLSSNRFIVTIDALLAVTLLLWIAGLTGVPQLVFEKLGGILDRHLTVKPKGLWVFMPPALRHWQRKTLAMFLTRARTDKGPIAPSTAARSDCVAGPADEQCSRLQPLRPPPPAETPPVPCGPNPSDLLDSTHPLESTRTDVIASSSRLLDIAPSLLPADDSTPHRAERRASRIALIGLVAMAFAVLAGFWNLGPAYFANSEGAPYSGTLRWFRLLDPFAMSSAMPFLCLVMSVYLWSLFALIRIARLERFPHHLPKPFVNRADLPRRTLQALCQELQSPWSETRAWGLPIALYCFCLWRLFPQIQPTVEGTGFDLGYRVAFGVVALCLLAELIRFVTLSRCLLEFLRDLAAEPMIDAYNRIANKVSGSFGLQLSARVPNPEDFQISVLTARALTKLATKELPAPALEAATREVERSMALLNASHRKPANLQRRVHEALMRVAGELHARLILCWKQRASTPLVHELWKDVTPKDLLPGGTHGHSPTAMVLMAALPKDDYIWIRAAEDFVALRTSTFVYQVLHELRQTLTFTLVGATLLASSMVCYPFQPARFLALAVWTTVVAVAIVGLWRMLALERNEVLSRLGGTQPDRIEWNATFVQQLALYVILPITAALIGLFPGVGDAIAAHLAPITRLLPVAS